MIQGRNAAYHTLIYSLTNKNPTFFFLNQERYCFTWKYIATIESSIVILTPRTHQRGLTTIKKESWTAISACQILQNRISIHVGGGKQPL